MSSQAEHEGNLVVLRKLFGCMTEESQAKLRSACLMLQVASDAIRSSTNGICDAPNVAIHPSPPATVCDDVEQFKIAKTILRGMKKEIFITPMDVVKAIGQWREGELFIPETETEAGLLFDKLVPFQSQSDEP